MSTFASPRVQFSEYDISQFVGNNPTTVGAMVIRSKRGLLATTFISDTGQLMDLYTHTGKSLDTSYVEQYAATSFLESEYAGLWVVRAVGNGATFAYIIVNDSASTNATTAPSTGLSLNTGHNVPVFPAWTGISGTGNNPAFILYAKGPGEYGNSMQVSISNVNATAGTFNMEIDEVMPDGTVNVRFSGLASLNPSAKDGYGNSIFVENLLANNKYVGGVVNTAEYTSVPQVVTTPVKFAGGVDADPVVGDVGSQYQQFSNTEQWDIDLFIQGGFGGDVIRTLLVQIAEQRGDALAVLDVDQNVVSVADITTWRTTSFNVSSSYGWVITPWLKTYDYGNDAQVYIPPSGVVAGLMAKAEYQFDPWFVPAGLNRGTVNVLGLANYYSLADRDALDKLQVNCFKRSPGVIALWNNRTLQTQESAFSFVETRRLLNYIKKNTCRTLDQFMFEPLVDSTRLRLVATLEDFMNDVKRRLGVLDYNVVSDPLGTGNNPPVAGDQGLLNVDLYIKPVRAVRYIQIRAIVTRAGYDLKETIV